MTKPSSKPPHRAGLTSRPGAEVLRTDERADELVVMCRKPGCQVEVNDYATAYGLSLDCLPVRIIPEMG